MVRIAAFICALLIYLPVFKINVNSNFKCLVPTDEIVTLDGKIVSNPVKTNFKNGMYRFSFACKSISTEDKICDAKGNVNVYLPKEIVESFYPGKLYTACDEGQAMIIEDGVNLSLNVKSAIVKDDVTFVADSCVSKGFDESVWGSVCKFRGLCRIQFKRLMYGWGKAGGFLLALLSGSREYTDKKVSQSFIDSGLAHIIALSGMHLSLFGGIALLFGKKISTRRIADFIQVVVILFFVWFAGLSPSLFRALLCSIFLFLSSTLRISRPNQIDILCSCFLVHCLIFPEHLFETAFLLSYFALAGILFITPRIKKLFSRKLFPYTSSAVATGCGAQIMTAPISIGLFGKLMPGGIISSVFVTPLVMFFIYAGLIFLVLNLALPFLTSVFSGIMNYIYSWIENFVFFFAKIPAISFK